MATSKTAAKSGVRKKSADFETSLSQLEALVTRMEDGELSLEESLQAFEEGVKLTRLCQEKLASAEQKVKELISSGEELVLTDIELDADAE